MPDIEGTSGNDILTGTASDDVINTYTGIDTVNAGAGNDRIVTILEQHGLNNQFDRIDGGSGIDTLEWSLAEAGSVTEWTLRLGASISGNVRVFNGLSAELTSIERTVGTLNGGVDRIYVTLDATVSGDVFLDFNGPGVAGYDEDYLILDASVYGQGLTVSLTNGDYVTSFGRFRNFELLTFTGSAFRDVVVAQSSANWEVRSKDVVVMMI